MKTFQIRFTNAANAKLSIKQKNKEDWTVAKSLRSYRSMLGKPIHISRCKIHGRSGIMHPINIHFKSAFLSQLRVAKPCKPIWAIVFGTLRYSRNFLIISYYWNRTSLLFRAMFCLPACHIGWNHKLDCYTCKNRWIGQIKSGFPYSLLNILNSIKLPHRTGYFFWLINDQLIIQ